MKIVPTTTSEKFVINGREYGSLDEMPEAERALFIAARRAMESPGGGGAIKQEQAVIETVNGVAKYTVNGREYDSLEAVPEAERKLLQELELAMPADATVSAQPERYIVDETKAVFRRGAPEEDPARATVTIRLSTLLWLLACLAVGIGVVAYLRVGRFGH